MRVGPVTCCVLVVGSACSNIDAPVASSPVGVGSVVEAGADLPSGARVMLTVPAVQARRRQAGVQAPLPITYHGGPVVRVNKVAAIYWSSTTIYAGGPTPGSMGLGSADGSVVGHFLRNLGGSPYWKINNEYTDQFGGRVGTGLQYTHFWAPTPGPAAVVGDAAIRALIIQGLNIGQLKYDVQTTYAVFAGPGVNLGGGFGSVYCAYHFYFHWGTKKVLYTVLPYAQDFPGVCTRLQGSPNSDYGADAIATPAAHELEEVVTDPIWTSWYDANRDENADKCQWSFGSTHLAPNGALANVRLAGRDFLVQQNWKLSTQSCAMS